MARIKYYYDTETCKYERVKRSITDVLVNLFGLFIVTLLIAVGLVLAYIEIIPNKKAARLKKENLLLQEGLDIIEPRLAETKEHTTYLVERDKKIYKAITGTELEEKPAANYNDRKYLAMMKRGAKERRIIQMKRDQLDSLRERYAKELEIVEALYKKARDTSIFQLQFIPAMQPIKNPDLKKFASGFGMRTNPIYKVITKHKGVDFAAQEGTPVFATADGIVTKATSSNGTYGQYVRIKHGSTGYETTYAHMQSFQVTEGQTIKRGDIIGFVGSTGKAVSPHLGYEIYYNDERVNPLHFLFLDTDSKRFEKLKEMAAEENQTLS